MEPGEDTEGVSIDHSESVYVRYCECALCRCKAHRLAQVRCAQRRQGANVTVSVGKARLGKETRNEESW